MGILRRNIKHILTFPVLNQGVGSVRPWGELGRGGDLLDTGPWIALLTYSATKFNWGTELCLPRKYFLS